MSMSSSDIIATQWGIADTLTLFYTIGGSILVVCAAVWGFKRVMGLLGYSLDEDQEYSGGGSGGGGGGHFTQEDFDNMSNDEKDQLWADSEEVR